MTETRESAEELLKLWREAALVLREAGGLLYPGSEPLSGTMSAEYRKACDTLGIPYNAWSKWLDALEAYHVALGAETPKIRSALGLSVPAGQTRRSS